MVYCLIFAKWKILMGHSKPYSATPNKQTCLKEERMPHLGHFAAADQAVSSARMHE